MSQVRLTRKGVLIPRQQGPLPEEELKRLLARLVVTPLAPEGTAPSHAPRPFKVYAVEPGAIYVPRFFVDPALPPALGAPEAAPSQRLVFRGVLRDRQVAVVQAAVRQCREVGGGLLVLPTGCGKTVCALWIACALGVRTLVLAHKSFLLDQWAERIAQYVPGAGVGRIQQGTVDVVGKDIVLGMMQSMSKRDYGKEAFTGFGLTIVDEVR